MPLFDDTTTEQQPLVASPAVDELLDERDTILIGGRLHTETSTVRAIETRVDTKAGNFLNLASGLLIAGLALLGGGKLPGPAAAVGWAAAAAVGVAVLLLTAALRPNLGGDFGFVRWAATTGGQDLLDDLAQEPDGTGSAALTEQARQLRWLSQSLHTKFVRIRRAQTLLVVGLTAAATAALVSTWAR
ncbi:hypothetical protein EV385_6621 [Krasilnikovia cinnamomea]|uniref:Pycsar effector protein domain-containing protein n=1 Tax=Krasilnikovia cinnamomea TaxID=349313 RepID=A0A4Q7Z7S9_9ACTN|nr:Pycsar system effector family protein [Krasilnikovia cinnamomea]RZU46547.1 hypothetical protein EV385_6621 [Krasilnikovia cinnamomea]